MDQQTGQQHIASNQRVWDELAPRLPAGTLAVGTTQPPARSATVRSHFRGSVVGATAALLVVGLAGCSDAEPSPEAQACDVFYDDLRPAVLDQHFGETRRHGERLLEVAQDIDDHEFRFVADSMGRAGMIQGDQDGAFEAFLAIEQTMRSLCQAHGLE